jgi:hypothetical protein
MHLIDKIKIKFTKDYNKDANDNRSCFIVETIFDINFKTWQFLYRQVLALNTFATILLLQV